MAPPDTRTLEGIIPADYQQIIVPYLNGRCRFNMINRQIIIYFTVKKVQEIKKNGYAAATKVLCLCLHFLPLLAVIAHYLVT